MKFPLYYYTTINYFFKNHRTMIIGIFLLLLLFSLGNAQLKSRKEPEITLVPEKNRTLISSFQVTTSIAFIRFNKIDGRSWIVETSEGNRAYQVPVDQIQEMLTFLSTPFPAKLVESQVTPGALTTYGLDDQQKILITIDTKNQTGPIRLELGSKSPNGLDVYLYREGKVYRAPLLKFYTMMNTTNSWISS